MIKQKVSYINGCGSATASTGVQAIDYPGPPTIMNTTANDNSPMLDNGVGISWLLPSNWGDNNVNTANRAFHVYRNSLDISGALSTSVLSYDDTSGTNNTFYTYHVDAINGCGIIGSYNGMAVADITTQVFDWSHAYSSSGKYYGAMLVQQTSDGGYILAGYATPAGSSSYDYWIVKLDLAGNITWQKTYGTWNYETANSVQQTLDGGYILAGYSYFNETEYTDLWIMKLDASGNSIWQKSLGGPDNEKGYSVQETSDGGYVIAGETESFGSGWTSAWIIKLNPYGTMNSSCTFLESTNVNPNNFQRGYDSQFGLYTRRYFNHFFIE